MVSHGDTHTFCKSIDLKAPGGVVRVAVPDVFAYHFIWKDFDVLIVLILFTVFLLIPTSSHSILILALLFSLPSMNSRNSDPGSQSRLFSPLAATVRALHLCREKTSAFSRLVDSRRNEPNHASRRVFYFCKKKIDLNPVRSAVPSSGQHLELESASLLIGFCIVHYWKG